MADVATICSGWEKFDLSVQVIKTLKQCGLVMMTPVQAACIPVFLKNKDVVVEAVTGSGKTLAFVVPVIEMLLTKRKKNNGQVFAVIITPTRELALQIWQVIEDFAKRIQFSQVLLVGGNPVEDDILKLKDCNIVIATPGRLEDLLIRQKCSLSSSIKSLEMLILDEADRLLDLGFADSLNNILKFLPKQRRTGLFSATMTKELQSLIRAGLRNPVAIFVKEKIGNSTPVSLENYYVCCNADQKASALLGFIQKQGLNKKYIIFFPTCASVEWFYVVLKDLISHVYSLHSKMGKHRRVALEKFKSTDKGVLLCTDVAARGIDVPEVHWVIQYDPPKNAEAFVHRVGRTARNGQPGSSLVFLLPSEQVYVDFVERNQNIKLKLLHLDWKCSEDVCQVMRSLQLKDRANYDRANKAFVSFVKFYSKHECSLIFRLKDLPLGRLAMGFGLLKLPKMPEIQNEKHMEGFSASDVDLNSIKYENSQRELARQKKLVNQEPRQSKKVKCKKRKNKFKWNDQDYVSLARDVALISKLKRKKISKEAFDEQFCLL